jgi:hypothetical protein
MITVARSPHKSMPFRGPPSPDISCDSLWGLSAWRVWPTGNGHPRDHSATWNALLEAYRRCKLSRGQSAVVRHEFQNIVSRAFATTILLVALSVPHGASAQGRSSEKMSPEQAREENAYAIGLQAYLWGFPLHEYSRTTPKAIEVGGAYLNDFRKYPELKTAKDRFVVTPNNVTIDAYATLDLTPEPVVVFVPALSEPRWYIVQIGDSFDEIARNVGGSKGAQPGVYVVTSPDFAGAVPGEMTEVKMRTKIGVVAVRILANGASDLPKAVEAQAVFRLMPLSAYLRSGLAYKAPEPRPLMPLYESKAPEDIRFFDELGDAIKKKASRFG